MRFRVKGPFTQDFRFLEIDEVIVVTPKKTPFDLISFTEVKLNVFGYCSFGCQKMLSKKPQETENHLQSKHSKIRFVATAACAYKALMLCK